MQSCYSSPQQLQAAAAAALSFHQHQQRLAFPLINTRRDDVDDDVNDDMTSRLTAAERTVHAVQFRFRFVKLSQT